MLSQFLPQWNVVRNSFLCFQIILNIQDIGFDPDGASNFEFYVGPYHVISLSFSENGSIDYAFLDGNEEECGNIQFNDCIPDIILPQLEKFGKKV